MDGEPMQPLPPWQQWMITNILARLLDSDESGVCRVVLLCVRSRKDPA